MVSYGVALLACGESAPSNATLPSDAGDSGLVDHTVDQERDAGTDEGGEDAQPDNAPPGCDTSADPPPPQCVTNEFGVFVSFHKGVESNAGTKDSPVKTIATALTKVSPSRPRVYICGGDTFPEAVTLSQDGVVLSGGWDCNDWHYSAATRAKIAPASGIALRISNTSRGVTIQDLQIEGAANAAVLEDSAIAIFAASAKVTLRRVSAVAHDGISGKRGDDGSGTPNWNGLPTKGTDSSAGGAAVDCSCLLDGSTSHGGKGGVATGAGFPGYASPDAGQGSGGTESATVGGCSGGQLGPNGISGTAAAGAPPGNVDVVGWKVAVGAKGMNGTPAAGGGGGGGDPAGGGGGGGCGGCGGAGGKPGSSGGSSFALLCVSANVTIIDSSLKAGNGGSGGSGGIGQGGQQGAARGTGACSGGIGGNGAGGGGGGGGAGGVSAAIAYRDGGAPNVDGKTQARLMVGAKGDAGLGGAGGPGGFQNLGDTQAPSGAPGQPGADGKAEPIMLLP